MTNNKRRKRTFPIDRTALEKHMEEKRNTVCARIKVVKEYQEKN